MGTKRKLQPMGEVMFELEAVLEKMTDPKGHDLQKGEVLALVERWIDIHAPHSIEEYKDGTKPESYYGPRRGK